MEQETITRQRSFQYQNLLHLIGQQRPGTQHDGPVLATARMRSIVNCHRLSEAYKEDAKVAYVSEQFPTEIAFAAGLIPWNIESMAAMLAQSMDVDRIFQLTQERELSRDICSFLRGPFGMMLAECYPRPDMVLSNDQPCEGLLKTIFMSGKRYDVPVFALHTPNLLDEDALDYLEQQLELLFFRVCDALGGDMNFDRLRGVIELSNQAREYYCKAAQLLETHKLPGVARELLEIFGMNFFGIRENVEICKSLYEEAQLLAQEDTPKLKRVLWIGQAPGESEDLLSHMGRFVDVIFWAPLWDANLMPLDPDKPFRGIAERAIRYHWNSERMEADIDRISDAYGIDGLLIANTWGCRNMMGVSPMLRDLAERKNIKYLTISIDPVDRNNYVFTHIKNRVDAFLETLH